MKLIASNQLTLTNIIDGTGLANVTNFYLASNQSTGIEKPAEVFNLIRNGAYPTNTQYWSGQMIVSQHSFYYEGQRKLFLLKTSGTAEILASSNRFAVKRNTNYTLSFYAFAGSNVRDSDVYFLGRKSNETNDFTFVNLIIYKRRFSSSNSEYVTVTFNSGDNDSGYIRFDNNGSTDGITAVLFFGEVMLVEGKEPKPWVASILDSGWTITPQSISYANRFLWNYRIELYTDGTTKATEPAVIGVYGDKGDQGIPGEKGADGRTQYTHIAYADNATGGGFSQTDQTKAYIGMYQDFTATDSTNPASYKWTKWKGSDGVQGVPGPKGADGKTSYIHFAYADDSKGTNFSLIDNNQQYQGYYSDYTEADSTDYTKYKWVDRLANVQVDGVNKYIAKNSQSGYIKVDETKDNLILGAASEPYKERTSEYIPVSSGQKITLQFWSTPTVDGAWNAYRFYSSDKTPLGSRIVNLNSNINSLQYFNFTLTPPAGADFIRVSQRFFEDGKIMLEYSTIPSDYTASPEDTQEQIDSKADQVLTQEQLNALQEQSKLMEAELKAAATAKEVAEWISAYKKFVDEQKAGRQASEQGLIDASNRVSKLEWKVGDMKQSWQFIDSYMTASNEGLIIGKDNASEYVKISSGRVSFFSGNSEVMYISQGVLNIDNGIFTKSVQIGRFRFEAHPSNQDMLVLRYIGG